MGLSPKSQNRARELFPTQTHTVTPSHTHAGANTYRLTPTHADTYAWPHLVPALLREAPSPRHHSLPLAIVLKGPSPAPAPGPYPHSEPDHSLPWEWLETVPPWATRVPPWGGRWCAYPGADSLGYTAHRSSRRLPRHSWTLFRFYNHLFILIFLFNLRKGSFSNVHKGTVRVSSDLCC